MNTSPAPSRSTFAPGPDRMFAKSQSPELAGRWNYPTRIIFGAGRVKELPAACRELGMGNPLLVTDKGLAQNAIVRNAVELCEGNGLRCAVFSDVQPNPVEDNVAAGVSAYRSGGHDGVIAFGGGSGLD